jgi:hypothetical protein
MCGWIKLFADGTTEIGTDRDIKAGKASWSMGRLKDIYEVRLLNLKQVASLSVQATAWHQFDRYSVVISPVVQPSQITHRVVQAEIQTHHIGCSIICNESGGGVFWAIVHDAKKGFFCKNITKHHLGKWLTMILPERDYPAIIFAEKGRIGHVANISR